MISSSVIQQKFARQDMLKRLTLPFGLTLLVMAGEAFVQESPLAAGQTGSRQVRSADNTKPDVFRLQGVYGTLVYDGTVERRVSGNDFEYTITELKLRFDPQGRINKVDAVNLRAIRLAATQRPPLAGQPFKVLHEHRQPVSLVLSAAAPTGTLRNLKFKVPREIITKADRVGFSATDDNWLWPMSGELK
jgi:hypothetical protein